MVCLVCSFVRLLCIFSVLSSFAIILVEQSELIALLSLSSWCLVSVIALHPFLAVPWVSMQCVSVVFPFFLLCMYILVTDYKHVCVDW